MRALHPIDCASYDEVHGGDIGTGSVAIYACLCCAMHAQWTMVGTDVDADALAHAQAMLDENAHVGTRVELRHTSLDAPLLPGGPLHFTLCNPPFYASPEERAALAASKREARRPAEGSHDEMYTPGGEAAFVLRMLDESMLPANRERIVYVARLTQLVHVHARQARLRSYPCQGAPKTQGTPPCSPDCLCAHRVCPRADEAVGRRVVVLRQPPARRAHVDARARVARADVAYPLVCVRRAAGRRRVSPVAPYAPFGPVRRGLDAHRDARRAVLCVLDARRTPQTRTPRADGAVAGARPRRRRAAHADARPHRLDVRLRPRAL